MKFHYHILKNDNKLLFNFWDNFEEKAVKKNNLKTFINQLSNIFNLNLSDHSRSKHNILHLKKLLVNEFQLFWRKKINSKFSMSNQTIYGQKNKLRTYVIFKRDMRQERYLSLKNFTLRLHMSQFRLSAHKLEIERGRFYNNVYVPANQRICKQCNLNICEDEKHFILECPLYTPQRLSLFQSCINNNPFFIQYNTEQKFFWLFSNEDMNIISKVAEYISSCMPLRKDMSM